jgi:hypothetical protein
LFNTISSFSTTFKSSWISLCNASNIWFSTVISAPLDPVIRTYSEIDIDNSQLPDSAWIAPSGDSDSKIGQAKPTHDLFRNQDFVYDLIGDEFGAPREWYELFMIFCFFNLSL